MCARQAIVHMTPHRFAYLFLFLFSIFRQRGPTSDAAEFMAPGSCISFHLLSKMAASPHGHSSSLRLARLVRFLSVPWQAPTWPYCSTNTVFHCITDVGFVYFHYVDDILSGYTTFYASRRRNFWLFCLYSSLMVLSTVHGWSHHQSVLWRWSVTGCRIHDDC